jgi:hypothetical protein
MVQQRHDGGIVRIRSVFSTCCVYSIVIRTLGGAGGILILLLEVGTRRLKVELPECFRRVTLSATEVETTVCLGLGSIRK